MSGGLNCNSNETSRDRKHKTRHVRIMPTMILSSFKFILDSRVYMSQLLQAFANRLFCLKKVNQLYRKNLRLFAQAMYKWHTVATLGSPSFHQSSVRFSRKFHMPTKMTCGRNKITCSHRKLIS